MSAPLSPGLGPGLSPGLVPDPGLVPGPVSGLEVKLGALVLLLSVSLLFGFAPLCLIRCTTHNPDGRRRVLSLCSCFAGGVFFATCLLDLLPDYLQGFNQAFTSAGLTMSFPLPEFIMAVGFFFVLVLEQIVVSYKFSSSAVSDERRSLLHSASSIQTSQHGHDELPDGPSPSALRAFLLVFSLSLHSVFEGLAVGLVESEKEVLEICLALVFHKSVMSLSLAFRLLQARLRRWAAAGCVLAFAMMSPLGVAIGAGLSQETQSSPQQQMVRSSLEGLAAGTFLYITFMEILPHELNTHNNTHNNNTHNNTHNNNMLKVCVLLLGFTLVTGVLFIKL